MDNTSQPLNLLAFTSWLSKAHLEKRDIIVMCDANVVQRMWDHAAHLHLLPVVCVRAAPRDAQLNGPAIHV